MRLRKELLTFIGLFIILTVLPVFIHDHSYIVGLMITCMIWGTMAAIWNFTMGYAGIFTFGQFGFFAIGAYISGMLAKHLGVSPWISMFAGGCGACIMGLLIGIPCMRLKGAYIALITWALHLVLGPMIKVAESLGTGGSTGLMSIPSLKIGTVVLSRTSLLPWYYIGLILSFMVLLVVYKIIFSSMGLGFIGLRDSEDFAKTLGINDYKYKLLVFGISAFLTGIVGAFYVHYAGLISPRILGLDIFLLVMLMLILGGIGVFPGAFIGAFIVLLLNEVFRPLGAYRFLIFGAIVIVSIKAMPEGLLGKINMLKGIPGKKYVGQRSKELRQESKA
jgi:branched-chain amino acid transport system permease protein